MQRKIKRNIRNIKKDIAGLNGLLTSDIKDNKILEEAQNKLANKQVLLKQNNSILNDFCKQTGLQKDGYRVKIGNVLLSKEDVGIILRDKSAIRGKYGKSQQEIEEILNNELKNIKFPVIPIYNARVTNGKTRISISPLGEYSIKEIVIGKQQKESKEFLLDTLLHEKLEAKIAITKTSKYEELNKMNDTDRHKYINKIIKRFFIMKGWNNGNR